jgi:hypothetical protein
VINAAVRRFDIGFYCADIEHSDARFVHHRQRNRVETANIAVVSAMLVLHRVVSLLVNWSCLYPNRHDCQLFSNLSDPDQIAPIYIELSLKLAAPSSCIVKSCV